MTHLPPYISITFIGTTLLTIWLFFRASNNSKTTLIVLILWAIFQSIIALSGFYAAIGDFPPRFLLLLAPVILTIIFLFNLIVGF